MNDTQRFTLFRKDLLRWFAENRRPLPWRADYTPYRTWIAEVMMQQTQMDRGVQYFLRWMERFPDVAAVAAAPEEDLLKAWEGLGYYRRARNIQAAARVIMERHVINGMKTSGKKRDNLGSIGKSFRRGCNSIAESATKKEGNQPSFFVGG